MEFCEKCGGMLLTENKKTKCLRCGYSPRRIVKLESSEKLAKQEEISIINEKEQSTKPIIEIKCKKCDNKKAYFWTMQTRAADESETKFYKCTKCEHTWRVYR
jgi:DNA-directed RNA polymerase subunit M